MKKIKIFQTATIAIMLAAVLSVVGCSIDPNLNNSPNDINQSAILTIQGQYSLLITMQGVGIGDFYSNARSRLNAQWTSQICAPPGLGRAQPVLYDSYTLTPDLAPDEAWKNAYYAVKTSNDIINNADQVFGSVEVKNANTVVAMAETYKATILGEIGAIFGSAPIPANPADPLAAPAYVDQKSVYAEVQRLLDDAIKRFGNSAAIKYDLTFKGDGTKWIPVCHSLKARYFLHLHDYANAYAEASQGIASASGNLYALYDATFAGGYSPWGHWSNDEQGPPYRAEKKFIDSLKSEAGDKRMAKYFNPNDSGKFIGYAAHGETVTDPLESNPLEACTMKLYSGYGDPFPVITADEVTLIKAECEARGQGSGVSAAVTDVNVIRTEAGLSAFASSDAAATLKQVLKQKWLQLFVEGQSYNDMRRTPEFPLFDKLPGQNYRWIYPLSEITTNPNVPTNSDALVSALLGI
ncbi:MAG TPA: SusD/RagB family nutrient-binding outer membrane lipoprotein [Candidatus Kapabacteria bacterium]|nr:SusD/RagB family nutrient-binding outer membrane lipoprotein [Candidatus Kapabacteria bacterium]